MSLPTRLGLFTTLGTMLLWVAACGSEVTTAGQGGAGATSVGAGGSGASGASGGGGTGGVPTGGTGGTAGAGGTGGSAGAGGTAGAAGSSPVAWCNPNHVNCAMPPPNCVPGEVPSVDGGCWGPCVPILSCETEDSCDDCQGGFCAEYVAWTVEYRCVLPTLQCSATVCGCLADYFCPAPYDACSEAPGPAPIVSCGCPSC